MPDTDLATNKKQRKKLRIGVCYDFRNPPDSGVSHQYLYQEIMSQVQWQEANIGAKAHILGHRRHCPSYWNPAGQVAVFNKVVLGEPNEVRTYLVKPLHLRHDFLVKVLMADAGVRRITKVVTHANPQILALICCRR